MRGSSGSEARFGRVLEHGSSGWLSSRAAPGELGTCSAENLAQAAALAGDLGEAVDGHVMVAGPAAAPGDHAVVAGQEVVPVDEALVHDVARRSW